MLVASPDVMKMRHLLIVGRDINQLVDLSIALCGFFHVTTVAVTNDIAAHALWSQSSEPCQIIACLDERDAAIEVGALAGASPPVLFLIPESNSGLSQRVKEAGCLVLSSRERNHIIAATLIAYGAAVAGARR